MLPQKSKNVLQQSKNLTPHQRKYLIQIIRKEPEELGSKEALCTHTFALFNIEPPEK
jgi:hypothetical protein